MPQWTIDDMVDMTGKTVIVTGGTAGIGYHCSKMFLIKNAKLYIGARDSQKTKDALARLKEETGKEAILLPLDLGDLHGVRKSAESFLSKENKLDILVNNAGMMASRIDELTKDGYDAQFGVNVLAPFHFTVLLLPSLLASPEPRVINVTSDGHTNTPRGGIDWKRLKGPKKGSWIPLLSSVEPILFYGQSKLGNILFTNELARRYADKNLVSISVHPGWIKSTLFRGQISVLQGISNMFGHPVEYGAVTQLFAANAPEAKKLSGKYLIPLAQVATPSKYAQDPELAAKMWEWCEEELKAF
ncbi:NAD(P)-binding protein [Serendipita vermifera]|nr:NAD(P)-binding protein [Serendipita vermifera]